MGWEKYLIEGFETLDRWQGEVTAALFKKGDYGIQLDLTCRVDAVELPADAEAKDEYHCWYGLGAKASEKWSVVNDGMNVWSADEAAGWVKTSKFGQLIQRCMDLNAPMIDGQFLPSDARAWIGLTAIFERTVEQIKLRQPRAGQAADQEAAITLPVQLLSAGVSAPSVADGAVPPPPPTMVTAVDFAVHWGANTDAWKRYIKSVAGGKSRKVATDFIIADSNCKPDSTLTTAVENGSFWQWAEKVDFLKEVDSVLV